MYKNAVLYKETWLAPGSQAFELYHDKDHKKRQQLDKHLAQLAEKYNLLTYGAKHGPSSPTSSTTSG